MLTSSVDGGEVASGEAQSSGMEIYQMDRRIPLSHDRSQSHSSFRANAWTLRWQGRQLPVTLLERDGCSIITLAVLKLYIRHFQYCAVSSGSQRLSIKWTVKLCVAKAGLDLS